MKPKLIKCMLCEYKIPHRDITEAGWIRLVHGGYGSNFLCLTCAKVIAHETIDVVL